MIYIVIPILNRLQYTIDCLNSLRTQSYLNFKIIIVDHGSSDGSSSFIILNYPEVIIIQGNINMWWAAATNLGVIRSIQLGAKYILTLNNDVFAPPNYLQALVNSAHLAPPNSLIGSTGIDSGTNKVNFRGVKGNWLTLNTIYYSNIIKTRPPNGLILLEGFPGRGLLIPVAVFKKIGLYDENYFPHYYADDDFTLRATKAGFKVYCSWDAELITFPNASGASDIKNSKGINGLFLHLTSIKGAGRLKDFIRYSIRHSPKYLIPFVLLNGTLRRVINFYRK